MPAMKRKYEIQKAQPEYKDLLANVPRILGVWDDHDFGMNNGGHEYADRDASQGLFLDFLDEPLDSPRRSRPGMYNAWTYGPVGKRVTLILLDVRYFKDAEQGGLLGEEQWIWFEKTLQRHSDSNLYLIGSGIQVLAPDRPSGEKWGAYPRDKARLINTLRTANLAGVSVLLSGDVHFAELSCIDEGLNHPLLELTSSGLSHSWGEAGEFAFIPRFSYISRALLFFLPARYQLNSIDYQRNITKVHGANYYNLLNYGAIKIDWDARKVDLAIHDQVGAVAFNHSFSFNKTIFHTDHVTCLRRSRVYDYIAPSLSRFIILVLTTVVTLDFGLFVYLVYRTVASLVSDEEDEKHKLS